MDNSQKNALIHLSRRDKVLSTLIKNIGICNLQPHKQYFNALLRAIVGQQLSMQAADSINKRFMEFFKGKPLPQDIIKARHENLRALGLSNAKVKYVKDLSQKIIDGVVILKGLSSKSDEEIIAGLTVVKGIGIWTVHMFLIFTLGRPNVLPYSDLGIRKAVMLNYESKKLPDEKKIKKIAIERGWHPYCSIASLYLWQSLDNNFFRQNIKSIAKGREGES